MHNSARAAESVIQRSVSGASPWLPFRLPQPGRVTVFCLPYAGGGASIYRSWVDLAGSTLQICPLQLPGRENRLREQALHRMDELIPALFEALRPHLYEPYILFGHSMGATIAFELALYLQKQGTPQPLPLHLVLSARRPPDEPSPSRHLHQLPEAEFIEELRHLRGTPEAVLREPELMALLMPLLRADFALIETHHRAAKSELDLPCTIIGGRDDELGEASLRGWARHLLQEPEVILMEGGHFYLHDQRPALLAQLSEIASRAMHTTRP